MEDKNKEALHIQQSIINLLIRVNALEKILYKKDFFSVEEYQQAIKTVGKEVNEKIEKELKNSQESEKNIEKEDG